LLLYNKAPNIALVNVDREYFGIRSRYLKNAQTFEEYIKQHNEEVIGFEKVIAACMLMGDMDFHQENLMVHQNAEDAYEFDKIDHGRSLCDMYEGAEQVFNSYLSFAYSKYFDSLNSKQITFNHKVFLDELIAMHSRLSPTMMYDIIDSKVNQLKKNRCGAG
ncbi:MAG: hypothetical protein ACK5WS_06520, partial [Alphaproteobacteria bacterium]